MKNDHSVFMNTKELADNHIQGLCTFFVKFSYTIRFIEHSLQNNISYFSGMNRNILLKIPNSCTNVRRYFHITNHKTDYKSIKRNVQEGKEMLMEEALKQPNGEDVMKGDRCEWKLLANI